ncbi:MAG: pilus assembly protein PilM [Thermodesulfobacteriota bacterium]|nr:pilus assembly protein PilM [Thermodesulfobacteriota bacterium]
MLRRTYLGLEIQQRELRAVAVQRQGKKIALVGGQTLALAETVLHPGFRQPNVLQPERFTAAIKKLLTPLAKKDKRIAVALPDYCGQLVLLELETPFKNQAEGAEIIRWQLQDLLPDKSQQIALDFQVLEEQDSGKKKILAAFINREVLLQYENLLEQAGYAAVIVDFHSLALYNAYRTKIDLGRDFILIGVDGDQLSIMIFIGQVLNFCRLRPVDQNPRQIFQEISRSLVNYRNQYSTFDRLAVHLHSDWQNRDDLFVAVNSAFDQQVQWLISPVSQLTNSYPLDFTDVEASGMATALGMAERMQQRMT